MMRHILGVAGPRAGGKLAALLAALALLGVAFAVTPALAASPKPDPRPPKHRPAPPPPRPAQPPAPQPVAPAPAPVVTPPPAAQRNTAEVASAKRAARLRAARLAAARAKAKRAAAKKPARVRQAARVSEPVDSSASLAVPLLLVALAGSLLLLGLAATPARAVPSPRFSHLLDGRREQLAIVGVSALVATAFFFLVVRVTA